MPKPIAEIKGFSVGMTPDITTQDGFSTLYCCDIFTRPGVLRVTPQLEADDDDAITELIRWFEVYDANGGTPALYAYDNTTVNGKIYYRTGGAWVNIHNPGNSCDGQGLKHFNTSLYYAQRGKLGQLTGDPTVGGNWNDNFAALKTTVGSDDYCPMVVFAGSLYIGNGRYVGKLEADEVTFDTDVLTLPVGYEIIAMIEWNDRIVMSTSSSTAVLDEMIVIWDGVSPVAEMLIRVPKPGATSLLNNNNQLKAFIGGGIYMFTGSDFILEKQLPKTGNLVDHNPVEVLPGAAVLFQERITFGATQRLESAPTFLSGVYSTGRHDARFPEALVFEHELSTGNNTDMQIGAIGVFGTTNDRPIMYVGYYDISAGAYGIDVIDYTERYNNSAYILTPAFEVGDTFGTLVQGVRLEFVGDMVTNNAQNKVVVKYRADEDIDAENDTTGFTTLGTIDNDPDGNDNQNKILYGISKRVKRIQFKFELTTAKVVGDNVSISKIAIY